MLYYYTDPNYVMATSSIDYAISGTILALFGAVILVWLARRTLTETGRYFSLVTGIATQPLRRFGGALGISAAMVLFFSALIQFSSLLPDRGSIVPGTTMHASTLTTPIAAAPEKSVTLSDEQFVSIVQLDPQLAHRTSINKALQLIADDRRKDATALLYDVAIATKDGSAEDKAIAAAAYRIIGSTSVASDPHEALDAYEHVRRLDDKDPASLFELARLYEDLTGTDVAIATYKELLTVAARIKSDEWQTRALDRLGRLSEQKGDLSAAEDFYRRSALIYSAIGDREAEAEALHAAGIVQTAAQHCETGAVASNQYTAYGIEIPVTAPGSATTAKACQWDTLDHIAQPEIFNYDPADLLGTDEIKIADTTGEDTQAALGSAEPKVEAVPYNSDLNLTPFDPTVAPKW